VSGDLPITLQSLPVFLLFFFEAFGGETPIEMAHRENPVNPFNPRNPR